ncbi:50S ribosomal protein L2 [bacterium]|nr:50S ribosomal protein L2 [bacterium]
MAVRSYKAYTPSRRNMSVVDYSALSGDKPHKPLLRPLKRHAGRNNQGRICVRSRGGGNKRKYRLIDFRRNKREGEEAVVISLQYDPNRTAFIMLVEFEDGTKKYYVAPDGVKVGDKVSNGKDARIQVGNTLPLSAIPVGTFVHNIELRPDQGAAMVRSAGTQAQILAREGNKALLRLPSGEMRYVLAVCRATIGRVSNIDQKDVLLGKAGRTNHRGRRPHVRGTVMNPVDHPHGGGEGKSKCAGRPPCSPTGVKAKGFRTRKKSKSKIHLVKDRRSKS